jgi:hypothetical protein
MWSASHRTADACPWPEGPSATSWPAQGRRPSVGHRRQHPRPPVHRRGAQPEVDRRLHLHLDGRRVALRRCRHRPVLAPRGRMVDERHHDRSARDRCANDGDLATRKARRSAASLGPGQPIHERAVPAVDGRQWRHLLDEPVGQRLGQRGNGELLLVDEDRTDRPEDISNAQSREGGRVRLYRALLQPDAPALDAGLSQPHGLRAASACSLWPARRCPPAPRSPRWSR